MNIGLPQGIILFFMVLNLGTAIAKHGQPKNNYSAGIAFIDLCINIALLYWGGFFR